MKVRTSFQGMSPKEGEGVKELVSAWAEKHLEPIMRGVGYAESELAVNLTKRKKGAQKFHVKLHMHVPPKKIVAAHARGDELRPALDEALDRLLREVQKHVSRVRHQEAYKRKARRARLRELKAKLAEMPAEIVTEAAGGIEKLLPRLEKAARRELTYLRSQGDLPPDYPTVQDVVDEVVAAVKSDWSEGADADAVYLKLLKAMHEVLDREVRNSRVFGEMESLELPPEPDAEDQAEAMVEEEFSEFWQPDELLKLEDVVENEESPEPEAVLEEVEEEAAPEVQYTLVVMRELPIQWRRALMLQAFEQLAAQQMAEVFGEEAATVSAWLDAANSFLDARMRDAGFDVSGGHALKRLVQQK